MWFDPLMNEPYELGIAAAVRDSGFTAVRIDRKEHNNQITDEIMAAIRGSEFMVADFTGHRAGVYYEAGFARGLGREVIYCCREDAFKERHFDTSVINHVVWTDPADLQRKLADRIRATILPKV
jgi:nucleoside 2-deoxyribosyltransferase